MQNWKVNIMNNYITNHFGKQRVVLPVIHVLNYQQAAREVEKCVRAQADGVFLISMDGRNNQLLDIAGQLILDFPRFWMGVNLLGWSPLHSAFHLKQSGLQGFWSDNARLDDLKEATMTRANFARAGVAHFGGFAFKYQPQPLSIAAAAIKDERMMDVLTTSGPGTGQAPAVTKIDLIRRAVPEAAIAIASGITPTNATYFPMANAYLCATGIEADFGLLNPVKLKALVDAVRSMNEVPA